MYNPFAPEHLELLKQPLSEEASNLVRELLLQPSRSIIVPLPEIEGQNE